MKLFNLQYWEAYRKTIAFVSRGAAVFFYLSCTFLATSAAYHTNQPYYWTMIMAATYLPVSLDQKNIFAWRIFIPMATFILLDNALGGDGRPILPYFDWGCYINPLLPVVLLAILTRRYCVKQKRANNAINADVMQRRIEV